MGVPVKYFAKVKRAKFSKLPNGATYYLDSDGSGPNVKLNARAKLAANTYPTNSKGTAVADVSVLVRRVGKRMLGQAILR